MALDAQLEALATRLADEFNGIRGVLGTKASFVIVVTGDEARPDGPFCVWLDAREGEVSAPANIGESDVRFRPGVVAPGGSAPSIVTTSLNSMTVDVPFAQAIIIAGEAPFTVSSISGTVPAGLILDADTGFLYGTPTADGAYAFTVQAENDEGTDSQAFSGSVADEVDPPVITTTTLDAMTVGVPFSQQLAFTGDTPVTWDESAGSWPAGISMSSSGLVSGTPTTDGAGSVTARVTHATSGSDTQVLAWDVDPAPADGVTVFDTPFATLTVGTDGGGALYTANRFYGDGQAFRVLGARIYIPAGASGAILSEDLTFYAYAQDYAGSAMTAPSWGSPTQTKSDTGGRTAGAWCEVMFDTPIDIAAIAGAAGANDVITIAVKFSSGNLYVAASNAIGGAWTESVQADGVGMAEQDLWNGGNSIAYNTTTGKTWYGLDIIYEVV